MTEIVCRLADLPLKVRAVTVVDPDGDFNVYVNSNLSLEEQRKAYKHELVHIRQNHHYINQSVSLCEEEARLQELQ